MPYAIFEDDQKLSRAFPSEQEALQKADEAGLVVDDGQGKPVLDDDLSIRPCPPDPNVKSSDEPDWALPNPGPAVQENTRPVNGEKQ
jgi:hypothetical protein